MKKIAILFTLLLTLSLFTSCQKENNIVLEDKKLNSEENKIKLENVLKEMKLTGDLNGMIVEFDTKNLSKKDPFKFIELNKKTTDIIAFSRGMDINYKYNGDNYVVSCAYGNGDIKTTNCSNAGCAGQATWDCLDTGGCATVCKVDSKISYYPVEIGIHEEFDSMPSLLDKIENISTSNNKPISFSIDVNNTKKTYSIKNINFKGISKKDEIFQELLSKKNKDKTYVISCYSDSGTTTTTCNDKKCTSSAVIDCTESGGCAEVCTIQAYFIPVNYALTEDDIKVPYSPGDNTPVEGTPMDIRE